MQTEVCSKILNYIMDENSTETNQLFDMNIWDWSQGVALYGMWKYYDLTKDKEVFDYLTNWFDSKIDKPFVKNVNTMAPLLTLCYLYEATGREAYLNVCQEAADWILYEMPKTEMGGLQHITIDAPNTEQLWADTVFMSVLFLARIGAITDNAAYMGEAKKQFLLHIKYLADNKTGLWYHGWTFEHNHNYAGAFWARGNCWFTMAAAELKEIMPLEKWVEDLIMDAYRRQVDTLIKSQHQDGLWHTLIDHEDAYVEVSGSAGFAYGILKGIRTGQLPASYKENAKKAVKGICGYIDQDGIVTQVSYGTVVADTLAYYKNVRLRSTGYGQNIVLMMLVELMYWEKQGLML